MYDAALILIGCILALVSLQRTKALREGERLEDKLVPYAIGGILAVVGVVANSAGRSLGVSADVFYVVSIIILCVGFAALTVGWLRVLVWLPRDKIASIAMSSFVISLVFGILDVLPREWASMMSALYPLLALIMLCLLQREGAILFWTRVEINAFPSGWLSAQNTDMRHDSDICGDILRCFSA